MRRQKAEHGEKDCVGVYLSKGEAKTTYTVIRVRNRHPKPGKPNPMKKKVGQLGGGLCQWRRVSTKKPT